MSLSSVGHVDLENNWIVMGDAHEPVAHAAQLARHAREELEELRDDHGDDDDGDERHHGDHDGEPHERPDPARDTVVLEHVDDRRGDERHERADREELDDRREHVEDVEEGRPDDDGADHDPDMQPDEAGGVEASRPV